eukprot:1158926-Pelagomonas_calceolata.AAC.10
MSDERFEGQATQTCRGLKGEIRVSRSSKDDLRNLESARACGSSLEADTCVCKPSRATAGCTYTHTHPLYNQMPLYVKARQKCVHVCNFYALRALPTGNRAMLAWSEY